MDGGYVYNVQMFWEGNEIASNQSNTLTCLTVSEFRLAGISKLSGSITITLKPYQ